MNLRDDIAALPGGRMVLPALEQVNRVDSGILSGLARRWRQAADQCATSGAAVTRAVARLDGQWTGATATAFTEYADSLTAAGETLSETLAQAADTVDEAAAAVSDAQSRAAARCEGLLSEVKSWCMTNPTASGDQHARTITGLCRQTAAEVGQLASTVKASLATLSGTFARLSGQERPYDPINAPGRMSITVTYSVPDYPQAQGATAQPARGALATPLGQRRMMRAALSPMRRASFTPTTQLSAPPEQPGD